MDLFEKLKKLTMQQSVVLGFLSAFCVWGLVDNYAAGHTMAYLACAAAVIAAGLVPWKSVGKSIGKLVGLRP